LSVNNPATEKTLKASPSSVQPDYSSTAASKKPASTATRFTSPTRSSTSSGDHAVSAAFTKSAVSARSPPAGRGSTQKSALFEPELIVCLGATAAQTLLGSAFRVTQNRGKILTAPNLPPVLATVHPSSILRAPDDQSRHEARASFVADLREAATFLRRHRRAA
jgi:hypothetical protein